MVERAWDTIVLGDGPVGLTTALIAARYGRVLVVLPRSAPAAGKLRIDCVPVALLALFIELGLHPSQLGASSVFDRRLVAWSEATPKIARGAGTVHLLRPVLEHCLLERARTQRAISFAFDLSLDALPMTSQILDATGRRAVTVSSSHSPANPAILRAIIVRGAFSRAQQAFRLASDRLRISAEDAGLFDAGAGARETAMARERRPDCRSNMLRRCRMAACRHARRQRRRRHRRCGLSTMVA